MLICVPVLSLGLSADMWAVAKKNDDPSNAERVFLAPDAVFEHGEERKMHVSDSSVSLSSLVVCFLGIPSFPLDAAVVNAPVESYFDPAAEGDYSDGFRVVGTYQGPDWSWGAIDLLEGYQKKYRTEGYNLRTQKLRYQDTWQDEDYPIRTYYGELNQEIVEAFNLYYQDPCASPTSEEVCADPGPTRPEARFVLLHYGPNTATGACDHSRAPVLLVHGAMQNANAWFYPYGNDGEGNPYPGYSPLEGFVQTLEADGLCTFALTFGNFHGDNFSQAINLSNALARIVQVTGRPSVDVVAWSKGAIAVDTYLSNPAHWDDWSDDYFEQIALLQAESVPVSTGDVRTYVALSGPHKGIDLNWRHPYDDLLIYSTAENAPVGQGPVSWGAMMAMQCVTWGYYDSPDDPWWPNPYAYSVCENRGGLWPDFWNWIYSSNIEGLDAGGHPLFSHTLEALNVAQGVESDAFDFDQYNIAVWGAVDADGRYRNAYLGQLQVTNDLRAEHPIRARDYFSQDWTSLDTDYYNWYLWLVLKLDYNPYGTRAAGEMASSLRDCRETAFEPDLYPCLATHRYIRYRNAESVSWGSATYEVMDGIGIQAAMRMGGNFIAHLENHPLKASSLAYLYVAHGTSLGPDGYNFEIDGLACPECDPHGDAVLFEESIGPDALDQLTADWTNADKSCRAKAEGFPLSHLEMGTDPLVWDAIMATFRSVDALECSASDVPSAR